MNPNCYSRPSKATRWTAVATWLIAGCAAFAGSVVFSGCAVQADDEPEERCGGPNCVDAAVAVAPPDVDDETPPVPFPSSDASVVPTSGPSVTPDAGSSDAAFSGGICSGYCSPQDETACQGFDPKDASAGGGLYSDTLMRAQKTLELQSMAGDAGRTHPQDEVADAAGDAATSEGEPPEPKAPELGFSCQMDVVDGQLKTGCALRGDGIVGDPCSSARDCGSGLGCVGPTGAATCLEYCCEDGSSCEEGRHCIELPLRSEGMTADNQVMVPVCAVPEGCALEEQLRCQGGGEDCKCPKGTQCSIIDESGATSCVELGSGKEGEPCECAAGFFCSQATNTCLEYCRVQEDDACGDKLCQQGPNFPDGWGLCVGADPEAAGLRAPKNAL